MNFTYIGIPTRRTYKDDEYLRDLLGRNNQLLSFYIAETKVSLYQANLNHLNSIDVKIVRGVYIYDIVGSFSIKKNNFRIK